MAYIHLDRQTFFPGNVVSGRVQNAMGSVMVSFTCELYQHWTTTTTRRYRSGKHTRTKRITHHHRRLTPIANMLIPVNPDGSFMFQLDYGCIPSLPIQKCTVRYYLNAMVNGSRGNPCPFVVLAPMQAIQWQAPSGRQEEKSFDITCCCCINKGKVTARFYMAKTMIALDRDQVCVNADIDASASEADIDNFIVNLTSNGHVKIAQRLSFSTSAGVVKVPANIKAGEKKSIQAIVQLNPLAAPSFRSAVVDIDYSIRCHLDMSWASDVSASFPVQVAHSVDMSSFNFQQAWQNTNFYSEIQGGQQPMMYQPPQHQQAFEMAPPEQFAAMPPIEFVTFETGDKDDEEDGDGSPGETLM